MSIKLQQEVAALSERMEGLEKQMESLVALVTGTLDPNVPFSIPRKPKGMETRRDGRLPRTADRQKE